MEHAKVREFFPKPSEILGLIRTWRMVETQKGADEAARLQRQELEHREANGEKFYGLADVMAEFRKVIDAKTELTPEQKKTLKGKVDALRKSPRKRAGA